MLRENVEEQCRKISPDNEGKNICAFAPREGRTGFIDTSGARDGTRGIAFFDDRMFVNLDGSPREILYGKIKRTNIISSFEDAFADELSIICENFELRVSDYSLDKFELKRLVDELCRDYEQEAGQISEQTEMYAEIIAQKLSGDAPTSDLPDERPLIEITDRSALPKDYSPLPIPDEKIDWLSGAKSEPSRPKLEVMSGIMEPGTVFGAASSQKNSASKEPEKVRASSEFNEPKGSQEDISETEMREKIENMSPEQMMKFLSGTLNEINDNIPKPEEPKEEAAAAAPQPELLKPEPFPGEDEKELSAKPKKRWEKLTAEPIWGDIYIKASQNLRELCESGKLTMEQMEDEIKARLLSTAEAFEKIISNESRVPKVMIPKIEELKSAAENFDRYFDYGEDIAIRAMFFMQYQMLTYADRIEESPETKDRLNDFFRRFGTAGITLSMLDMRV